MFKTIHLCFSLKLGFKAEHFVVSMNNRLVLITGIFGLNAFLVKISKQTSTDNVKENVKFMAHIGFLWIFLSFLD